MLYNPRSTERDNQNALRKYPFSDGATCTNGACVIPPGAIIDAQLYIPGREPGRVWLSRVDTDGILRFSDGNGEFAKLSQAPVANSAVQVTFTGDGGPLPGGVVVFGEEQDVAALRRLGGQSFTAAQAELAPASVSWPGLPGVLGFRLDDGHVVYGDVKIRGENGCAVATYIDKDGNHRLRISAVGRKVEDTATTGFITAVVADSDNTNFTVKKDDASDYVIDIQPTGVTTMIDGMLNADQENMCSQVKTAVGTSSRVKTVEMAECEDGMCASTDITPRKITLFDGSGNQVTWTDDAADSYITALTGGELSPLLSSQIPSASMLPAGLRFAGYYDNNGVMYYRYDGTPVRRFTADNDVSLHAEYIAESSEATVSFQDYGTLHLAAPSTTTYTNPLRIYGTESPIPTIREHSTKELTAGGAEALAEIILKPESPVGEIHIGIRGANKISIL